MKANATVKGTVVSVWHESEVLRDNPLGDPNVRDLFIYLPPGYEDSSESYPSVYCLTGFTGRGKMLLNDSAFTPNLAQRLDKLIADGTIRPMIVVMPDCFTYFGGSQYINSTATGNYEDYLTEEIVAFVDENFRTINDRNSRAVMGKSSGGYGALILGLRHADKFGLVCCWTPENTTDVVARSAASANTPGSPLVHLRAAAYRALVNRFREYSTKSWPGSASSKISSS